MIYLFSQLNRYFCHVYLTWFVICTGIIGSVVSLFEGTELARKGMGKAAITLPIIFQMVMLKLPGHIQLLFPFIILSTTIVTFWRLNSTHELISARGIGLSIWQILSGLLGLVATIGLLQLIFLNPLSAAFSTRFDVLNSQYFHKNADRLSVSSTGLWLREVQEKRHSIVHAQHAGLTTKLFSEVNFYNFSPTGEYLNRVSAKTAQLKDYTWTLQNVSIWEADGTETQKQDMTFPSTLTIEKIQESKASPETIAFWNLPESIEMLEKSGLSSLEYRLYWHVLIAKIGMMLAMVLLAATFSLRPHRQGKTTILITLGVCSGFLLHFLNDIVYALGLADKLPIILSAWAPTIIVVLLSVSLLLHLEDG